MKSMTGYGYAEYQDEKRHYILEVKSYNNRYLDILISIPNFLNPLETEIREVINKRAERGRIEVYLKVREIEEDVEINIDNELAKNYSKSLKNLLEVAKIDDRVSLSHILALEGVVKEERQHNIDEYRDVIIPLLEDALNQWEKARIKEGKETLIDILKNIAIIEDTVKLFSEKSSEIEGYIKANIKNRFKEVLGDAVAEQRFLAETAVLLVKYSINEEIARLTGHIDSLKQSAESKISAGKKMDFICQELNREINTIGSKSFIFEINNKVIEAKDGLEKIREQLRNIE